MDQDLIIKADGEHRRREATMAKAKQSQAVMLAVVGRKPLPLSKARCRTPAARW